MLRVGSNDCRRAGWQKLPDTQWPRFRAAAGTLHSIHSFIIHNTTNPNTIQPIMIYVVTVVIGVLPDGRILLTGGRVRDLNATLAKDANGHLALTGGREAANQNICETLTIHDRTRVTRTWSSVETPSKPINVEEKKKPIVAAATTPVVAAAATTTPTVSAVTPATSPTTTTSPVSSSSGGGYVTSGGAYVRGPNGKWMSRAEAEKMAAATGAVPAKSATAAPVTAAAVSAPTPSPTPVTPPAAAAAATVSEVKEEESKDIEVANGANREGHTVAVMDGKYYICGGIDWKRVMSEYMECYDPTDNEWKDVPQKSTVTSKLATTLEWQGKIYVFDASEEADSQCFHKYDPEEKSWDKYAENIGIQYSHCVGVSVSRGLLMLGVATMNAKMFMMQLYEPDKDSWVVLPLMIPFTPNDCNIVAKVIDDKWLVLVGGNSESDKHNCYMIDWAKAVSSAAAAIVQGRADGTFDDELDDHPMAMFLYPQAVQAANEHWIPLPNYPLKCNLVSASAVVV
jgi:N-acetylneuraminic acid mutarotase